jgi:hypothetical protein
MSPFASAHSVNKYLASTALVAAYDLKKLRGKEIVRRIGHSRRYEPLPTGLRAMTALLVLRNKAIKPPGRRSQPARRMTQNRSMPITKPFELQ